MTFKPGDLVRPKERTISDGRIGLVEYIYQANGGVKGNTYVKVTGYGIAFKPHELKMVNPA